MKEENQEWININDRMPNDGDKIIGMNGSGGTWKEVFDPDEPIGRMRFWRLQDRQISDQDHG